jgi:hypothetical protein
MNAYIIATGDNKVCIIPEGMERNVSLLLTSINDFKV